MSQVEPQTGERRILVIDDSRGMALALELLLTSAIDNLAVDRCQSAFLGLEWLSERHYDVILTDIVMPGVDGFKMLEHARERCPDAPVVLMTGAATRDLHTRAFKAGAHDLIEKPCESELLIGTIERALEAGRARREARRAREAEKTAG